MAEAKIEGSAPILLVEDVAAAANYYRDQLGFCYDRFWGDPPEFCILCRDNFHVMLARAEPENIIPHHTVISTMWNIYFWVNDVESLYEELEKRGATIDYGLTDKDYGCREFGVKDLDGYDIAFGQHI